MEPIMEPITGKIVEAAIPPLSRQFGYILHYKANLKRMKTNVQILKGIKDSVQHKVDAARRSGEEIEDTVLSWLNTVDNTVVDANELIDSELHAKARKLPHLFTRHQLSRKMTKMIQTISELVAQGNFDAISYRAPCQVTISPFGRGYEALDSRTSMLNEIMLALKDPNFFIIGVYGMGGVGKTTLVKELAWQAEKDGSIGVVVMATNITSSPNVKEIQGQIADALDLKFNKETKEGRSMQLRERISKLKSILVILDDVWGKLDLEELGIPFGDDHKG
jgi:hypothetical protein